MSHTKINISIIIVFCCILFSSCITPSKFRYLQQKSPESSSTFNIQKADYIVQNGDNLYVKFSSTEPETNLVFSSNLNITSYQGLEYRYRDVYLVDNSGNVRLPQLGMMHVANLSIQQIRDSVEMQIHRYFKQVIVDVRLADNYISIIGQVNRPGRYPFDFRDKISIFELISMAGDLNYDANRKDIKLLRKNGDSTSIISLDLTKRDVLNSPYYYLYPNDVVYVEPLKAISLDQRSFPFTSTLALVLSVTTSILVIISYFR